MRILITNNTLALRAGSELYVRDLALALLARGHDVVAYSRVLGEVGEELRAATVPVVDDLECLRVAPDLIHGQHHLETMTALLRFPGVPAIYVCHGWLPAEEAPPRSPRVRRYLAVDELVRRRLCSECGIPAERVVVQLNFVDLDRFLRREPLPPRPLRALVFSNEICEDGALPVLRAACAARGMALEVAGAAADQPCRRPESMLGRYDLVFAKGRCALEAAAVGVAVVLCGFQGLGPLVTAAGLDELRAFNFGVRLLRGRVTPETVGREIDRYDPDDAARVRERLRAEAGLAAAVERLLAVYSDVLEESRRLGAPDPDEEGRAHSYYLRWGPLTGGDFHGREREALRESAARLRAARDDVRAERDGLLGERGGLLAERDRLRAEGDARCAELDSARTANTRAAAELAACSKQIAALERQVATHDARAVDLEHELQWITGSLTWRLRAGVVRRPWLVALYRRLCRGARGPRKG